MNPAAGPSPAEASNVDLVREMFDRLWSGEFDAVRDICTDETVARFPTGTVRGGEDIAAFFEEMLSALPDLSMELLAVVGEGDDVLIRWRMTATHATDFGGIATTGKPIAIDGFEHFVFRHRKLASAFVVSDQMQFARQLGMIPPEGSVPDRVMKAAFGARTRVARAFGALRRR